jgi:hypothetical protein
MVEMRWCRALISTYTPNIRSFALLIDANWVINANTASEASRFIAYAPSRLTGQDYLIICMLSDESLDSRK